MSYATQMLGAYPDDAKLDAGADALATALVALSDSALACAADTYAGVRERNRAEMVECIRVGQECADICTAAVGVQSRPVTWAARVIGPLLATCRSCGDECERHAPGHEHCRVCAEACRLREQAGREFLNAVNYYVSRSGRRRPLRQPQASDSGLGGRWFRAERRANNQRIEQQCTGGMSMSNDQPMPATAMPAPQAGMQTPQGGMMQAPQGGMMQAQQGGMMPQGSMMQAPQGQMMHGGHLYTQTNEIRNCVIHFFRAPDGKISEMDRVFTRGAGSGTYKPVSGQESAPNAFEGANSVIITPDRRFLFATNGGDNSVSSFAVSVDGKLALLDAKRTGNVVAGRSGTAKALAYSNSHNMLYVLHAFGPDHLRLMSVDDDGTLTARPERYTVNTSDKPNRVATMASLTADEKFLVVGTTFDEPAKVNPDGSPILWVKKNGVPHSIASNAPDPDGLIVFPVGAHGTLGEAKFQDGGGGSPWNVQFLRHRPDHFVLGYAVGDGLALGRIDEDGNLDIGPVTQIDTSGGKPTELCWCSLTPDDRLAFAASFGYSYASSFRIEGNVLSTAKDPACPKVSGDGTFRALNGTVSGGSSDNWICPTGAFYYQLYPNASKLAGYAIHSDGSLEEITSASIPYQSPQGLTGF